MIHTAQLRSIATAHPPTRLTREDWLAIAGEISPASVDRAILARLADRSGIDARWCAVLEGGRNAFYRAGEVPGTAERMQLWLRAAKAMAVEAGTRALADAGIAPAAVTHVVTASCTGFAAPSVDAHAPYAGPCSMRCRNACRLSGGGGRTGPRVQAGRPHPGPAVRTRRRRRVRRR